MVRRIGSPDLRTHVVAHRRDDPEQANAYQNAMGDHLAREHLLWVIRRLGIDCVLDVGANSGQFAKALRRAGYDGRIVSFEPVASVFADLRAAAASDPGLAGAPVAAGDEDGEAEINVRPGTMSSLLPSSDFGRSWAPRLRESTVETIAVRRLDGLLDDAVSGLSNPRVLLKLDTQGFDLAAFRGLGARVEDVVAPCSRRWAVSRSTTACRPCSSSSRPTRRPGSRCPVSSRSAATRRRCAPSSSTR